MSSAADIRAGIADTLPLGIAVIPWGILAGALAVQVGLSPLQAQIMSLLVFAGAAQLSVSTMLSGGAGLPAILSSVFVISSRHLLYSIVFRQYVMQLSLMYRLVIGFLLTDEMFAVSEARTRKMGNFSALHALVSGITFYASWNLATLIGVLVGGTLQDLQDLGLDFAIVATFIAMTFESLSFKPEQRPTLIAVVASAVLSVVLQPFFADGYIVIAGLLSMVLAYGYWALMSTQKSVETGASSLELDRNEVVK